MASITGVPANNADVKRAYSNVRQSLPAVNDFQGFLSSHQTAVAQLALTYCNVMVDDPTLRSAFFPGSVNFTATLTDPSDLTNGLNASGDALLNTLREKMIGTADSQPQIAEFDDAVGGLIENLCTAGPACGTNMARPIARPMSSRRPAVPRSAAPPLWFSNRTQVQQQDQSSNKANRMFIIKSQRKRALGLNEPLKHGSHKRPVTRRDFLAQGFTTGAATVLAPAGLGLLTPRHANAALSVPTGEITACGLGSLDGQKIPFICFDLAGGANIAGSNVLVGQKGGQLDFLSTQGYSKLGLPGNMLPNNRTTNFVDTQFGLAFHSDSAFLRGMLEKASETTRARVNGAVIAARSENDTGNNPHNPMYGLAAYGAKGKLLTLIGSQNSESGGNSMAPARLIDPQYRPTKIDRVSDVTGLVDTGDVATILSPADTVRTLETMYQLTGAKLGRVSTDLSNDVDVEKQFKCAYLKSADTVDKFSSPDALDPSADTRITNLFGGATFSNDGEFQKTASVMKLVIDGNAGAGTISMGGFDYHTGDRATGEARDLRAGRCIGACLEYAALVGVPLMIYVFSDGSLSSNGRVDDSAGGRGKGEWTGDNQQTAASFFLVFNPTGRPTLLEDGTPAAARHQQLGYYTAGGDVVTSSSPAANNVNLLVETVILNYMALNGDKALYNGPLGTANLDGMIAFNSIV